MPTRKARPKPPRDAARHGDSLESDPVHRAALLESASERLPIGNAEGVVGLSIGPRRVGGRERGDWTLRLHVGHKQALPPGTLDRLEYRIGSQLFTVVPDVQAVGGSPLAGFGVGSEWSGVHAGSAIASHGPSGPRGGVAGIFAPVGAADATHLLTAGHLFSRGAIGAPAYAAVGPFGPVVQIGVLVANFLDVRATDVALVALTPVGAALAAMSVGPEPAAIAQPVWRTNAAAFCPTLRAWTPELVVEASTSLWYCYSPARGQFAVYGALATFGRVTREGDSGTCICNVAEPRELMGSCVGAVGTVSLFQPIAGLEPELAQLIGSDFVLWRRP